MRVRAWALGLLLAGGWAPVAQAGMCALCRQALASGGNGGLIRGFYWSILLIAGVPLALMGALGILVWRQRRRRISQRSTAASPLPLVR